MAEEFVYDVLIYLYNSKISFYPNFNIISILYLQSNIKTIKKKKSILFMYD